MKLKLFTALTLLIIVILSFAACNETDAKPTDTTADLVVTTVKDTTETTATETTVAEIETTQAEITTPEEQTTVQETSFEEETSDNQSTTDKSEKTDKQYAFSDSYSLNIDLKLSVSTKVGIMNVPVEIPYQMTGAVKDGDFALDSDTLSLIVSDGVAYFDSQEYGKYRMIFPAEQSGILNITLNNSGSMEAILGNAVGQIIASGVEVTVDDFGKIVIDGLIVSLSEKIGSNITVNYDNTYIRIYADEKFAKLFVDFNIALATNIENNDAELSISGKITADSEKECIITPPENPNEYTEITIEDLVSMIGGNSAYDEGTAAALGISKENDVITLSSDPVLFEQQVSYIYDLSDAYKGKTMIVSGIYNEYDISDDLVTQIISNFDYTNECYGAIAVENNGFALENDSAVTVKGTFTDNGFEFVLVITDIVNK